MIRRVSGSGSIVCSSLSFRSNRIKCARLAIAMAQQRRWFGEEAAKLRSPYAVLGLRTSATKDDIKGSFRKLAKKYHPDLNPNSLRSEAEEKMAELIDAYEQLMDDDFGGRVGDSRVALACEMYTIEELRMDRLHDVYSIKIVYEKEAREKESSLEITTTIDLSSKPLIEIAAHPDDSVSDLKRELQSRFMEEWGLGNRRLDRDKIATGWELVTGTDGTVLSYHLFLHSYGIKNNDIIHAVVRKYNEVEREVASSV